MPRSQRPKPACQTVGPWLLANLGKGSLGVLTGTDSRALSAAIHIVELYAVTGDGAMLEAFRIVVNKMQPSARHLAYHATAHLMEWDSRARVWARAGLAPIAVPRCENE